MSTLNTIRRHLAAALLVALVALALPHPANAQPILRGKVQQAALAVPANWQPVSSLFAVAGQNVLPAEWAGLSSGRLSEPVMIVEVAPAPAIAPAIDQPLPLPALPWLNLLLP